MKRPRRDEPRELVLRALLAEFDELEEYEASHPTLDPYPRPDLRYDAEEVFDSLRYIAQAAAPMEDGRWEIDDFHDLSITYTDGRHDTASSAAYGSSAGSVAVEVDGKEVYASTKREHFATGEHVFCGGGLRYVGDFLEDFEYVIEETEEALQEYEG